MKNYRFKVKRNRNKNILGMRVMFKKCSKCGEVLFKGEFTKRKEVPSGLASHCKRCVKNRHICICKQCKKEFKSHTKSSKFCSNECQGKYNKGENNPNWNGGAIKCNCDYCNKEFETTKTKYGKSKNHFCSRECRGKWQSENLVGENNPCYNRVKCNCDYCGKEINKTLTEYNKNKNHFCSYECQGKWKSENLTGENNPSWKGGNIKCNCDYCGKEIEKLPSNIKNNKHNFCSQECHYKWQSENIRGENHHQYKEDCHIKCNCDYCGKEINKTLTEYNKNKNHFCNRKCQDKWQSENRTGENNPRYNPNITDEEREQERKYPEYNDWRKDVFKRDDYTCQCCGKRGNGEINAHHIYGYAEHKDLRTDVDNGVTLCEECHKEYHKQYGYTNNNYKDFRTFLYNEMMKQNTLEAKLFYINTIEDITLRLEIKGLIKSA